MWQRELKLDDWSLYFVHKSIKDAYATMDYHITGRAASITLNTNWINRDTSDFNLKKCALHEVVHIMLSELSSEAKSRYTDQFSIEKAEEALTVKLTNLIIEGKDEKRISSKTAK